MNKELFMTRSSRIELCDILGINGSSKPEVVHKEVSKLANRVKKLEKAADNLLWRCIESYSDVADSDAWKELERLIK